MKSTAGGHRRAMKSQIKKVGEAIVVQVDGKLDYETQDAFKERLRELAQERKAKTDSVPTQVIFNMEKLEFVGSSGITQYIQTLKDFAQKTDQKAKILNASSEFKKVMKAFDEEALFEFDDSATNSTARGKGPSKQIEQ